MRLVDDIAIAFAQRTKKMMEEIHGSQSLIRLSSVSHCAIKTRNETFSIIQILSLGPNFLILARF